MMKPEYPDPLMQVVAPVRRYLQGELPAPQLGRIVDDLVSANLLSALDPAAASLVDKLQIALALYTPDKVTRQEEPQALIGPFDLLREVRKFDEQVRALGY